MVTSAEPKPVMPNTSAPRKPMPASAAASGAMDQERVGRTAIHAAQLRHIARKRQAVARLQLLGPAPERGPVDRRRRAAKGKCEDVRIVERRHRQHGATEG